MTPLTFKSRLSPYNNVEYGTEAFRRYLKKLLLDYKDLRKLFRGYRRNWVWAQDGNDYDWVPCVTSRCCGRSCSTCLMYRGGPGSRTEECGLLIFRDFFRASHEYKKELSTVLERIDWIIHRLEGAT